METAAKITAVCCIAILAGIVVWDICLAVNGRPGDTISEVVRHVGQRYWWFSYTLVFALGLLVAHFFRL